MSKSRINRRIPLAAVLVIAALAVGLFVTYQGATGENPASAVTTAPTGPVASGFTPADGDEEVSVYVDVSVRFNVAMRASSIDDSSFYINEEGQPPLPAAIRYSSEAKRATLDPSRALKAETVYVVTITDDIESLSGVPLHNPQSWSFTTDSAPEVIDLAPDGGDTDVPLNQVIAAEFDKDMQKSTFTTATFYLQKSGATAFVKATVTYDAAKRMAFLIPASPLAPNTTYHATLTTGVGSESGLAIAHAPIEWSFTTIGPAPAVSAVVPAAGSVEIPLYQAISATFTKPMNAATITTSTFYIQESGGSQLPATVSYDPATRKVTLTTLSNLKADTTYRVTLVAAIKGDDGQVIADAPVVWTFSTVSTAPRVVSTVPAHGASGVPVEQTVSVTFDKAIDQATLTVGAFQLQTAGGSPLAATVAYDAATRTATLTPAVALDPGATYQVTVTSGVKGSSGLALLEAPVTWSFTTAEGSDTTFSDVTGSPYATAIYDLAGRRVITGFEDGTFRPNDPVSRQQFAKMVVLALKLTVTGTETSPFVDVAVQVGADPLYPSKYVAVCAARGITTGKTATTFEPSSDITRQQLITMVVRAAGIAAPPPSFAPGFGANQFLLAEHYENARKAAYAGLLGGLQGVGPAYAFVAPATRGECAQILYNLIALVES